ncbi:MAG: AMP-binding protein [Flavobacteriales bacterium]|nr:AMP-binding protein [Flavobacteriales bacterium]
MAFVFDRLLIDGELLIGKDLINNAERMAMDPNSGKWARPMSDLIIELVTRKSKAIQAHTSGTTGTPTLIQIPRRDLIASAKLTARAFDLHTSDRVLLCLPGEFIAGKMMIVRAMVLGLDLNVIDPRGSILEKLAKQDRFKFAAMVPLQLHRAVQEDRERVEQLFETILLGGGPVSNALIEDIRGLNTAVFQSYGSTETITHVAIRPLNTAANTNGATGASSFTDMPFRAIGKCSFQRDLRGCLVVNTPHLSVKQHVTNDIVELIDDGTFRWLGRWDNVILSGGKKIFPEQLETRTAGVIPYPHYFTSTPDDQMGQAVCLVLEANEPADIVLPEVMDKLMHVLDPHELPRRVRALRSFARTESGKVIRIGEPV